MKKKNTKTQRHKGIMIKLREITLHIPVSFMIALDIDLNDKDWLIKTCCDFNLHSKYYKVVEHYISRVDEGNNFFVRLIVEKLQNLKSYYNEKTS